MNKEQVFKFVTKNPVFALATAEENIPRVRYMMLYRADENGLIFNTGENKDIHAQLQANPQVELCFIDPDKSMQIRIAGTVEILEDLALKKQVVKDFPFLKEWVDREGYDVLITYCLKNARAIPWTMEKDSKPKEYIQL
jgi:uncharacterized pyridoxamine 5'-phosphate oxidase family protein